MDPLELIAHFDNVKGGNGQYTARCPAHDDKHNSLSIGTGKDGKILLCCQAGCNVEQIVDAANLKMPDLFVESTPVRTTPIHTTNPENPPSAVATYNYYDENGQLVARKIRQRDKNFFWQHRNQNNDWENTRAGVMHLLYSGNTTELPDTIFVVEGEKDVDTLQNLGKVAVSGMDGAGPGKWHKAYTERLRGKKVYIIQDNDEVGREYAQQIAVSLEGVATEVHVVDLATVWPEITDHGDTTDLMEHFGPEHGLELLSDACKNAKPINPQKIVAQANAVYASFQPLTAFNEEKATWLVQNWIPTGQLSLLAAAGGVGKTTLWCNIVAAISSGKPCILDPPGCVRQPAKVLFFTAEDSVRKKLKKQLQLAGADMNNIFTPDFSGDNASLIAQVNFGSRQLLNAIAEIKPALCIFDPIQGFLPSKSNMSSRSEMRNLLTPLLSLSDEINMSTLLICHTNKRKLASGRDRIADSADLWDIARSVMMVGFTGEDETRYLSQEKSNYAPLQETVLFNIDDGKLQALGTSWKKDEQYTEKSSYTGPAPKREDAKAFILKILNDNKENGPIPVQSLDKQAANAGFSVTSMRRAKSELKVEGKTHLTHIGDAKSGSGTWLISSTTFGNPQELAVLPDDTDTPFDQVQLEMQDMI